MQWAQKHKGFTIVELLIVVVVIAILAAITIVAYNGIQNRAKQSAAQATAIQASKKIAAFAVDNSDTYPDDLSVSTVNLQTGGDTRYEYWRSVDSRSYCLTATKNNVSYFVSNSNATPQNGACDGHAANGAETITNLVLNPSLETNLNGVGYMGGANTTSTPSHTYDWASNGSRSLRITKTTTASTPVGVRMALPTALNEGDVVRWAVTVYNSGATSGARSFGAYGERNSPSYVGYNPNMTISVNPGSSGRVTGQMTITAALASAAGTAGFGVLPYSSFAIGESYLVDGFIITVNQPLPTTYVDGNTAGWAWKGTPNASASTGPYL